MPVSSLDISRRQWNIEDKGRRESARERTFMDDIVQKAFIERKLLENLDGVQTVFDGGAGAGRFSILLAKRGIKVTHFDLSRPMLDEAKRLAKEAGVLENIGFVEGALEDLSAYSGGQFDMVISFDAPISYTYPNQEAVIHHLCRMAGKRVMFLVSSRLGTLPYFCSPWNKLPFLLEDDVEDGWVRHMIENRQALLESFRFSKEYCLNMLKTGIAGDMQEEKAAYARGESPWPITYGFMPGELKALMEKNGVRDVRLAGPGAYARGVPREILRKIMKDETQKADFLSFCYEYDQEPYVLGVGKDNLFAMGEK